MKAIIIAIVAILLIGGGAYLLMGSGDDEMTESNSSETVENSSFNALLAKGENAKCTYDYTDAEGYRSYGTAYFAGDNRMYGDFTSTSSTGEMNQASVIRNGDTQYVWQADSKEGYKSDVSASTEETQSETSETVDPDENYEFKCVKWNVDESVLEVPSDVEFIDIAAQLQQTQQQTQEAIENACSQLTDATARAACEAALPQ